MSAKKSLMDSMQDFDKGAPVATIEPPRAASAEKGGAGKPPSRHGKRAITGYVPSAAFQQFQILRAERGKDVQELVEEALNDLFQKYGKPPIA